MKVTINEKAKTLTIEMALEEPRESSSGKTLVIASSHGNQKTGQTYKGSEITVGVNAYIKNGK